MSLIFPVKNFHLPFDKFGQIRYHFLYAHDLNRGIIRNAAAKSDKQARMKKDISVLLSKPLDGSMRGNESGFSFSFVSCHAIIAALSVQRWQGSLSPKIFHLLSYCSVTGSSHRPASLIPVSVMSPKPPRRNL